MRRLYISVFGSGLGHATRMLPVARLLERTGFEIEFSSSAEVTTYLRREGYRCEDVPLVDVVYTAEHGSFSARETLKFIPIINARLIQQIRAEARNVMKSGADVVLSDSVITTVVAGRAMGKRVVTVLNQLRLESSPGTPAIAKKLLSTGSINMGGLFWNLSDEILLPDLPPPYTISERNLWSGGRAARRAKYIGFLIPPEDLATDALTEKLARDVRKKIFWQISGPPATRSTLLSKAIAIARDTREKFVSIISAGNPSGDRSPVGVEGGYLYEWCPVKDMLVKLSDIIVSRAGHTSLAQFILNKKPTLLIPITSHGEQEGNALKAASLGISVHLEENRLTRQTFSNSIDRLSEDRFRTRVEEMCRLASRYDATSAIASAVAR